MGKCGNWADATMASFTAELTVLRLSEDNPAYIVRQSDRQRLTVPENAGSQRRRGSTDLIMLVHLLAEAAGVSFFFSLAAAAASAML